MTANRAANLYHRLRADSAETDADLLARFLRSRDAAAFAALVQRHGPLVLGVCRRTLGHAHDAEDAFQATFLALAQKAETVRSTRALASWLYGVAWRVAKKAKRRAARRREEWRPDVPEPPTADVPMNDLGPVLDEELAALPEWYRAAVLACDVEQLSRAEAAAKLGIAEGTLSSRLAAGRKRLADRLARRGVTLALPALATLLTAGVSEALVQQTVETVGQWAAGGVVAKPVAELTHEGLSMARKLLLIGTGILAAGVVGVGLADDPPKPEKKADPKPAEVKAEPKPTESAVRYGAPRMKKSVELPIEMMESLAWTPDGRHFALNGHGQFRVPGGPDRKDGALTSGTGLFFYDADLLSRQPMTFFHARINEKFLGLTQDGRAVAFTAGAAGRINSQKRIGLIPAFDAAGRPVQQYPSADNHPEPITSLPLEADAGSPLGLTADGKTLVTFETSPDGNAVAFRSAETGDVQRRVPVGQARQVHTARDFTRVAYVTFSGREAKIDTMMGFEVAAAGPKSTVWAALPPKGLSPYEVEFSDDGERVVTVFVNRAAERVIARSRAQPRAEAPIADRTLTAVIGYDAATGHEAFRFTTTEYFLDEVRLSFDGRLAAAHGTNGEDQALVVFETATGRVVKKWPLSSRARVVQREKDGVATRRYAWAFSPVEPKLLVVEPGETSSSEVSVGLWVFPTEKK